MENLKCGECNIELENKSGEFYIICDLEKKEEFRTVSEIISKDVNYTLTRIDKNERKIISACPICYEVIKMDIADLFPEKLVIHFNLNLFEGIIYNLLYTNKPEFDISEILNYLSSKRPDAILQDCRQQQHIQISPK